MYVSVKGQFAEDELEQFVATKGKYEMVLQIPVAELRVGEIGTREKVPAIIAGGGDLDVYVAIPEETVRRMFQMLETDRIKKAVTEKLE